MAEITLLYMFYFTSICGSLTLLFTKHIDARTVFFISTLVYGLPLYWGYTEFTLSHLNGGLLYKKNIVKEVYIIFIMCHLIYLLSLVKIGEKSGLKSYEKIKESKKIIEYKNLLYALNISLLIAVVAFVSTTGIDTFSMTVRSEKISNYTIWYYISGVIAVLTVILGILLKNKNWKLYLLPISYLFFDLITGDRTVFFLGFISFVISYFGMREIGLKVKERLKIGITLFSVLLVAFVYKPFYFAISLGYFKVEEISEYLRRALVGSEPFVIIGNLNEIIMYGGISLNRNYLFESIGSYLPFYETITGNSRAHFNSLFQPLLFPYTEWGAGSTSFGEVYSIGGMLAVSIYILFIFCFLKLPLPTSKIMKMLYYFIVPYILFYFHRTDWHSFIGMLRFYVMSFILIIPVYLLIHVIRKSSKKVHYEN